MRPRCSRCRRRAAPPSRSPSRRKSERVTHADAGRHRDEELRIDRIVREHAAAVGTRRNDPRTVPARDAAQIREDVDVDPDLELEVAADAMPDANRWRDIEVRGARVLLRIDREHGRAVVAGDEPAGPVIAHGPDQRSEPETDLERPPAARAGVAGGARDEAV